MIYRNETLIDWAKPSGKNSFEETVYQEITALRNKYFGSDTMKHVVLLYPRGKFKEAGNSFTVQKLFPVPLHSSDGVWRYSDSKIKRDGTFTDSAKFIKHYTSFYEKDIEFLWFLTHKSSVLNKFVFIEDLEEEAQDELDQMATDAEIRFMLLSDKSPIAKDEKAIKQVAEIFNVHDVDKRGLAQVKKDLYNTLVAGQKNGDRFVNYEKFDELTQGEIKRKAAFKARECINDGVVKYKDRAWWIMYGGQYGEQLMTIKLSEAQDREQLLIEEIISNANTRSRLFSAIGEEEFTTAADYRELNIGTLRRKVNEEVGEGVGKNNDKKEDLIRKLCEHKGVDYQPDSI